MFLFVYGTLMRGHGNHRVIERSGGQFMFEGVTVLPAWDLIGLGGFPGLVQGEHLVAGEVYEVQTLEHTDRLEGYPRLYGRKEIYVRNLDIKNWGRKEGDKRVVAWAYTFVNVPRERPYHRITHDLDHNFKYWS